MDSGTHEDSPEPSVWHEHSRAIPAAPYSARPPSPPGIWIPVPKMALNDMHEPLKLLPTYENIDPATLSVDDLGIITQGGREQIASDAAISWVYEDRRKAQQILDFLYLGPSSVARDRTWLREEGITMLLAARDSRMAGMRLMAVDNVARELGIQAEHVDVSGHAELIHAFPSIVRLINNHMLDIYHRQALQNADVGAEAGSMAVDKSNFRRGKVLVLCETGNDRSAGVVIAYLMSLFGMNLVTACQFVHYKRFCVSLDEEMKQLLKSYEDILDAQRMVHQHQLRSAPQGNNKTKRLFEETKDQDEEMGDVPGTDHSDQDRFHGRAKFVPFVDSEE
ncbi:protein-tyrosine phosphatase-like protein [Xylariomycetidae sp. FL0641]|nr:protein-tyrosine phosphatase-like protein [Xylariomycetidae sp. FL0641]